MMLPTPINPLKPVRTRGILGSVTFADLFLGFAIGFPMMIAVGPISVLLFDQGLERGIGTAGPAALGVATADLTLALVASFGGAGVARLLGPTAPALTLVAVAVLLLLAFQLGRSAMDELRAARAPRVERRPATVGGPGDGPEIEATVADEPAAEEPARPTRAAAFGGLTGFRLGGAFFGLTLVNPLTVVLFASVVVAGGRGIGTIGWALGMALASLVAHGGFLVAGALLRTQLSPVASGRLRLGAAVFMGALALHFALG